MPPSPLPPSLPGAFHFLNTLIMESLNSLITIPPSQIPQFLDSELHAYSREQQFETLINFIFNSQDHEQDLVHVIIAVWTYIQTNQLWNIRYDSLTAFQKAIDFNTLIRPYIEREASLTGRVLAESAAVFTKWNVLPQDAFEEAITPPKITLNIVRHLHRLSQICSREQAMPLIKASIEQRQHTSRSPKYSYVLPIDLINAYASFIDVLDPNLFKTRSTSTLRSSTSTDSRNLINSIITVGNQSLCGCPSEILKEMVALEDDYNQNEANDLLISVCEEHKLTDFCHSHLRRIAAVSAGLYNNISGALIRENMMLTYDNVNRLDDYRNENPSMFRERKHTKTTQEQYLSVYKYPPVERPQFKVDPRFIFTRFAGINDYETWKKDGSIIIPDVFNYLNQSDILQFMDMEFNMYRFHFRPTPGRPNLGFLRNMFYGIIQQLVRQDPVWYALIVAARPDHQWRLISYPYVIKFTEVGESTGFLHMDLNLKEFLTTGHGANLLTSSLSLDQEYHDGCTVLVPGFHHNIFPWVSKLKDRQIPIPSGTTTDCKHIYTQEDRQMFGYPKPFPCPMFGIRISLSTIIHGSTPKSPRQRRAIYPWFIAVKDNHVDLEINNTLSWPDVGACIRDLEAPSRGVGGEKPTHSLPNFRFPASVIMKSGSALCDALIARRKWIDPEVLSERNILFGSDHQASLRYVQETRRKLLQNAREAFSKLESIEREAFGPNSYFLSLDQAMHD